MSEPIIVKLANGTTLVGKVELGPDSIEITHPIELVSQVSNIPGLIGEQINLRPWIAIAEGQTFTIDSQHVITTAELQLSFHEGYHRMVDQIYLESTNWTGSFIGEEEEAPQEENSFEELEELLDYAEAIDKKQIH